jgi:hypothetical protein
MVVSAFKQAIGWRSVAIAALLLLAGCDYLFPEPERHYNGIDVYADHFEYRYLRYENTRTLRIALEAARAPVEALTVRECIPPDRLAETLAVLRGEGQTDFQVILPEDC